MRKVVDQNKTTQEELANDLITPGTRITKNTIDLTLHCDGLKSCSTTKVPLFKKPHAHAHLKFAREQ